MRYFRKNWTGKIAGWILVMETKCRDDWSREFLPVIRPETSKKPEDTFLNEFMGLPLINTEKDEFENYVYSEPTVISDPKTFNPIIWWNDAKAVYPSLYLYVFDILAIPAMSVEYERVFSSIKKLITPERNRLAEEIIEVFECLKNWWDRGLI
jgi:hypothetical protein